MFFSALSANSLAILFWFEPPVIRITFSRKLYETSINIPVIFIGICLRTSASPLKEGDFDK